LELVDFAQLILQMELEEFAVSICEIIPVTQQVTQSISSFFFLFSLLEFIFSSFS
jgi:hypothetical protein